MCAFFRGLRPYLPFHQHPYVASHVAILGVKQTYTHVVYLTYQMVTLRRGAFFRLPLDHTSISDRCGALLPVRRQAPFSVKANTQVFLDQNLLSSHRALRPGWSRIGISYGIGSSELLMDPYRLGSCGFNGTLDRTSLFVSGDVQLALHCSLDRTSCWTCLRLFCAATAGDLSFSLLFLSSFPLRTLLACRCAQDI